MNLFGFKDSTCDSNEHKDSVREQNNHIISWISDAFRGDWVLGIGLITDYACRRFSEPVTQMIIRTLSVLQNNHPHLSLIHAIDL